MRSSSSARARRRRVRAFVLAPCLIATILMPTSGATAPLDNGPMKQAAGAMLAHAHAAHKLALPRRACR
jgi:hypothetical protein